MAASETVIRASNLRKVYRLYVKPKYRFLDLLGLLPSGSAYYTEHPALDGIDLEVRKGEKVCVIGRNGAGKSTLLKLVTKVIQPTSGLLEVREGTRALLQIGTGFHPDFTGRENVLSYLAHMGITGDAANKLLGEIIDFAELEEYRDQPIKSYSTGMAVRLMFAAATVIAPALLVIDEVLGVGDAYFAHKSFDRIRSLCEGQETTLLLVTHDIYNAAKLCTRMLWIDHGKIVIDGDPKEVINAYEDSIRRQEERRLRLKHIAALKQPSASKLLVELKTPGNRPLTSPIYFSRIAIGIEGTVLDELPIVRPSSGSNSRVIEGDNAWGVALDFKGRRARPMMNYGTVFHKVAGIFDVTGIFGGIKDFHLEVDCWTEEKAELEVIAYLDAVQHHLGAIAIAPADWQTISTRHVGNENNGASSNQEALAGAGRIGSGAVVITGVRLIDQHGNSRLRLTYGHPCQIVVDFTRNNPEITRVQIMIIFHRDGVQDVCRLFASHIELGAAGQRAGQIVASLPRLMIGTGRYTLSAMITEAGYFETAQVLFYAINPGVFDCWARLVEIEVVDGGIIGTGTGVVAEADWSVIS